MRRRHRRKDSEPLVPINGGRVMAAIEAAGLSVRRAAVHIGEKQATLNSIVKGTVKRCRSSRRTRLAGLLRCTEAWLGGEDVSPFGLPPWHSSDAGEERWPLVIDENFILRRLTADGHYAGPTKETPRYELRALYLGEKIVLAWRRDIEAGQQEAQDAIERLIGGSSNEDSWLLVLRLVQRLIACGWWRRLLISRPNSAVPLPVTPHDAEAETIWTWPVTEESRAEEVEASEAFAIAAADSLETVLRPWLIGTHSLGYDHFSTILKWTSGGMLIRPPLEKSQPRRGRKGKGLTGSRSKGKRWR
jgi:hypothetical protein